MCPKNAIRENSRYSPQYTPTSKPVSKTFIIIAITVAALVVLAVFLVFTNKSFVGEAIKFKQPKVQTTPKAPAPVKSDTTVSGQASSPSSPFQQVSTGRETTDVTQIKDTATTTAQPVTKPVGTTATTQGSTTTQPTSTTNVDACLSVVSQLSVRDKEIFCQQVGVSAATAKEVPACDVNTCVTVLSEALLLPEDKEQICQQIGASAATTKEVPACQKAKTGTVAEQALLNNVAKILDDTDKLRELTRLLAAIKEYAEAN